MTGERQAYIIIIIIIIILKIDIGANLIGILDDATLVVRPIKYVFHQGHLHSP